VREHPTGDSNKRIVVAARLLTIRDAIRLLKKHYPAPTPPPTSDPFELILWENVAYLATPARRREAFAILKRDVGTTPIAILAASQKSLENVTERGILKSKFAAKLRESARIVLEELKGDLESALREPQAEACRLLQLFPGIGKPGAEKILLFSGRYPLLAPESNGLRVLARLGIIREEKSYARTYVAGVEAASGFHHDVGTMQEAHLLLHLHGQTLCSRAAPKCSDCPLEKGCAYAISESKHG
jgi:endonuclease III